MVAQTAPAGTTIRGTVFDSLGMRGLPGRVARGANATTDSLGRFEFASVGTGTYLVGFIHPVLDSLGIDSQLLRVDIRTDAPVALKLATPSRRAIVQTICGKRSAKDSTGLLIGFLRGADNSMPRHDGKLWARWSELVIERGRIDYQKPTASAQVAPNGLFAVCGLPIETPLLVQASSATDSSGLFEITVPSGGLLHRDVLVAPTTRRVVAATDSTPASAFLRGAGSLRGKVTDANGRGIVRARVSVWGTGLETTTNDSGSFALGSLPTGTHTLEARAVGFTPAEVAVDVAPGLDGANVQLTPLGVMLAPVNVKAQRAYSSPERAALERRMKMGFGHVYDEKDLDRQNPQRLTDFFQTVPGLHVVANPVAGDDVLMRGDWGLCRPDYYVDGVRRLVDDITPVNFIAPMQFVRAVEVYPHTVPAEFLAFKNCGVIVIWTGRRPDDNRR